MDRRLNILLVEDSAGDVRLLREALSDLGTPHELSVARDGEEALDFLWKRGRWSGAPTPDLVLLDLNLPKRTGHEVLKEIKQTKLRRIPVLILSSSRAGADVQQAYELQANCYIVKPRDLDGVYAIARAIQSFWFNVAILPPFDTTRHDEKHPAVA